MRPTFLRRVASLAVLGAALTGIARGVEADPPAWERAIQLGIADQDTEIAHSSAKAVASRLASQASRNRQDLVVHYLLARAFGLDNQRADAITAYGEALAIEPGCWYAWRDRGVLRWLEKDLKGAEQDLRQALTLNPRMLEALQELGRLLIEEKRYAEGIRVLTRALDVDPGLDSARFKIAEAFAALNHPSEALQTLVPLLAKAPNDVMLRVAQARYLLASEQYAAAQAIFKQLAIENPNDPAPLNAWLGIAVKAKSLDAEEGVWVLEQLRRLARTADERGKITKEIEELRRQASALLAPPTPKGPPTAEDLARALRAPEVRAREAAAFYILTGVKEGFTITGELATALIERLRPAEHADAPAKGEDVARIRALALEILARYGTPEFASIVRGSLHDPDGNVRRKAADALGLLKNKLAVAALWRYAKGADLDLAVSARLAVYQLAQKAPPAADATSDAQAAAFTAWWTSSEARDVKLAAITEVLASADRAVDELLFPLAYLDADDVVGTAAHNGLKTLAKIAGEAAAEAKRQGKDVPPGIDWMRSLPILGAASIVDEGGHSEPGGLPDPTAPSTKPYRNPDLAAWWMRRPK